MRPAPRAGIGSAPQSTKRRPGDRGVSGGGCQGITGSLDVEDVAFAFDPEHTKWVNVGVLNGWDAQRLKEAGVRPGRFAHWASHGFTIDDCLIWRGNGFAAVMDSARWRDAGFTADQAAAWRDLRFVTAVAREWADLGCGPEEAHRWDQFVGGRRKQDKIAPASAWRQHFTVDEAYGWRGLGFSLTEAVSQSRHGNTPDNFALIAEPSTPAGL